MARLMMLLDGPAIAADPELAALELNPATIRKWLQRGLLEAHGRDARGRVLLDYDAVVALATARRGGGAS